MKVYRPVNFQEKFSKFTAVWSPRIVAEMNDYQFKLVNILGEFVWHDHKETDEVFIVLIGEMEIEFRDGAARIKEGEMFVVPRGTEHRPRATSLCKALVIEPCGVVNTGDAGGVLTAPENIWV